MWDAKCKIFKFRDAKCKMRKKRGMQSVIYSNCIYINDYLDLTNAVVIVTTPIMWDAKCKILKFEMQSAR